MGRSLVNVSFECLRALVLCSACLLVCLPVKAQPDTAARPILPQVPLATPLIPLEELHALVGGPTLVSLQGHDLPLEDVLQALLSAAGFPQKKVVVTALPQTPKSLTLNWNRIPFWQAAAEVEKRTGLRWNVTKTDLELVPPSATTSDLNGVVVADTPFLKIIANRVTRATTASVPVGAAAPDAPNSNLSLTLSVYPDPKLQSGTGSIRISRIGTNKGNASIPAPINAAFYLRKSSAYLFNRVTLQLPATLQTGSRLASVQGVARMTLTVTRENWKVSDLLNSAGAAKKVGNNEYRIEGAQLKGNQLMLNLGSLTPNSPLSRLTPGTLYAGLHIKDGQGRELARAIGRNNYSIEPDGRQELRSEVSVSSAVPGKAPQGPFSLEWDIPTQIRTLDTPFEITDVVVP